MTSSAVPAFATRSGLVRDAFEWAQEAHGGQRRQTRDSYVAHPVEVARMLHAAGFADPVVAAALLHDVVEDSGTSLDEIRRRFGPEVGDLVDAMTEDESIDDFTDRKAAHRDRIRRSGSRDVAAIFAADKVSKAREMAIAFAGEGDPPPDDEADRKQANYEGTLEMLDEMGGEMPFAEELRVQIDRLRRARTQG